MGVVIAVLMMAGGCRSYEQEHASRPAANPACARVATQRAQDAGYNGQSAEIQRATYDAAYKSCVADQVPTR